MRTSRTCFAIALLVVTSGGGGAALAEVAVIGHPSLAVDSISEQDARNIFLGKTTTLTGGANVTAADQNEDSPTKNAFYKSVIQKDPAQLKAYWSKMIFSGRGTPPPVVGNDEDAKKWAASTPGGITYVNSSVVDGSVKVLMRAQ